MKNCFHLIRELNQKWLIMMTIALCILIWLVWLRLVGSIQKVSCQKIENKTLLVVRRLHWLFSSLHFAFYFHRIVDRWYTWWHQTKLETWTLSSNQSSQSAWINTICISMKHQRTYMTKTRLICPLCWWVQRKQYKTAKIWRHLNFKIKRNQRQNYHYQW